MSEEYPMSKQSSVTNDSFKEPSQMSTLTKEEQSTISPSQSCSSYEMLGKIPGSVKEAQSNPVNPMDTKPTEDLHELLEKTIASSIEILDKAIDEAPNNSEEMGVGHKKKLFMIKESHRVLTQNSSVNEVPSKQDCATMMNTIVKPDGSLRYDKVSEHVVLNATQDTSNEAPYTPDLVENVQTPGVYIECHEVSEQDMLHACQDIGDKSSRALSLSMAENTHDHGRLLESTETSEGGLINETNVPQESVECSGVSAPVLPNSAADGIQEAFPIPSVVTENLPETGTPFEEHGIESPEVLDKPPKSGKEIPENSPSEVKTKATMESNRDLSNMMEHEGSVDNYQVTKHLGNNIEAAQVPAFTMEIQKVMEHDKSTKSTRVTDNKIQDEIHECGGKDHYIPSMKMETPTKAEAEKSVEYTAISDRVYGTDKDLPKPRIVMELHAIPETGESLECPDNLVPGTPDAAPGNENEFLQVQCLKMEIENRMELDRPPEGTTILPSQLSAETLTGRKGTQFISPLGSETDSITASAESLKSEGVSDQVAMAAQSEKINDVSGFPLLAMEAREEVEPKKPVERTGFPDSEVVDTLVNNIKNALSIQTVAHEPQIIAEGSEHLPASVLLEAASDNSGEATCILQETTEAQNKSAPERTVENSVISDSEMLNAVPDSKNEASYKPSSDMEKHNETESEESLACTSFSTNEPVHIAHDSRKEATYSPNQEIPNLDTPELDTSLEDSTISVVEVLHRKHECSKDNSQIPPKAAETQSVTGSDGAEESICIPLSNMPDPAADRPEEGPQIPPAVNVASLERISASEVFKNLSGTVNKEQAIIAPIERLKCPDVSDHKLQDSNQADNKEAPNTSQTEIEKGVIVTRKSCSSQNGIEEERVNLSRTTENISETDGSMECTPTSDLMLFDAVPTINVADNKETHAIAGTDGSLECATVSEQFMQDKYQNSSYECHYIDQLKRDSSEYVETSGCQGPTPQDIPVIGSHNMIEASFTHHSVNSVQMTAEASEPVVKNSTLSTHEQHETAPPISAETKNISSPAIEIQNATEPCEPLECTAVSPNEVIDAVPHNIHYATHTCPSVGVAHSKIETSTLVDSCNFSSHEMLETEHPEVITETHKISSPVTDVQKGIEPFESLECTAVSPNEVIDAIPINIKDATNIRHPSGDVDSKTKSRSLSADEVLETDPAVITETHNVSSPAMKVQNALKPSESTAVSPNEDIDAVPYNIKDATYVSPPARVVDSKIETSVSVDSCSSSTYEMLETVSTVLTETHNMSSPPMGVQNAMEPSDSVECTAVLPNEAIDAVPYNIKEATYIGSPAEDVHSKEDTNALAESRSFSTHEMLETVPAVITESQSISFPATDVQNIMEPVEYTAVSPNEVTNAVPRNIKDGTNISPPAGDAQSEIETIALVNSCSPSTHEMLEIDPGVITETHNMSSPIMDVQNIIEPRESQECTVVSPNEVIDAVPHNIKDTNISSQAKDVQSEKETSALVDSCSPSTHEMLEIDPGVITETHNVSSPVTDVQNIMEPCEPVECTAVSPNEVTDAVPYNIKDASNISSPTGDVQSEIETSALVDSCSPSTHEMLEIDPGVITETHNISSPIIDVQNIIEPRESQECTVLSPNEVIDAVPHNIKDINISSQDEDVHSKVETSALEESCCSSTHEMFETDPIVITETHNMSSLVKDVQNIMEPCVECTAVLPTEDIDAVPHNIKDAIHIRSPAGDVNGKIETSALVDNCMAVSPNEVIDTIPHNIKDSTHTHLLAGDVHSKVENRALVDSCSSSTDEMLESDLITETRNISSPTMDVQNIMEPCESLKNTEVSPNEAVDVIPLNIKDTIHISSQAEDVHSKVKTAAVVDSCSCSTHEMLETVPAVITETRSISSTATDLQNSIKPCESLVRTAVSPNEVIDTVPYNIKDATYVSPPARVVDSKIENSALVDSCSSSTRVMLEIVPTVITETHNISSTAMGVVEPGKSQELSAVSAKLAERTQKSLVQPSVGLQSILKKTKKPVKTAGSGVIETYSDVIAESDYTSPLPGDVHSITEPSQPLEHSGVSAHDFPNSATASIQDSPTNSPPVVNVENTIHSCDPVKVTPDSIRDTTRISSIGNAKHDIKADRLPKRARVAASKRYATASATSESRTVVRNSDQTKTPTKKSSVFESVSSYIRTAFRSLFGVTSEVQSEQDLAKREKEPIECSSSQTISEEPVPLAPPGHDLALNHKEQSESSVSRTSPTELVLACSRLTDYVKNAKECANRKKRKRVHFALPSESPKQAKADCFDGSGCQATTDGDDAYLAEEKMKLSGGWDPCHSVFRITDASIYDPPKLSGEGRAPQQETSQKNKPKRKRTKKDSNGNGSVDEDKEQSTSTAPKKKRSKR